MLLRTTPRGLPGDIVAANDWSDGESKQIEVGGRFQNISGLFAFGCMDLEKRWYGFKLYGKRFYYLPYRHVADYVSVAHNPFWWLVFFIHAFLGNVERRVLAWLRRQVQTKSFEDVDGPRHMYRGKFYNSDEAYPLEWKRVRPLNWWLGEWHYDLETHLKNAINGMMFKDFEIKVLKDYGLFDE